MTSSLIIASVSLVGTMQNLELLFIGRSGNRRFNATALVQDFQELATDDSILQRDDSSTDSPDAGNIIIPHTVMCGQRQERLCDAFGAGIVTMQLREVAR